MSKTTSRKENRQNINETPIEGNPKEFHSPQQLHQNKEIALAASDIEDEIQLKRREAYIERPTQMLLREFLEGGKENILPIYDPSLGFTYPAIDLLLENSVPAQTATEFLDHLTELSILNKTFHDSIATCPNCESTTITTHYRCPKCKKHNIAKTSLTEHIPCGYIAEKEQFTQNRCPKCGETIKAKQYRDMGRWYICRECNEKFERPEFDLICRKCDTSFTIEKVNLKEISKYSINSSRIKEIRQNVTSLESLSKLLTSIGFTVEVPGTAIGERSRMQHHFSVIAKKQHLDREIVVGIDHAVADEEVQASALILYVYKTSEVKVDFPIFVAVPKISETARKIAVGNGIMLIEGVPDEKDSIPQIRQAIEKWLKEGANQPLTAQPKIQPEKEPNKTKREL